MTAKPKSWSPWFEKRKFRDPIGDRKRWEAKVAASKEYWKGVYKERDQKRDAERRGRELREQGERRGFWAMIALFGLIVIASWVPLFILD